MISKKSYLYTVKEGDTLYSIAHKFGSSDQLIKRVNYLYDPGQILPGNLLVVPSLLENGKTIYIVHEKDTVSGIVSRFSTFNDLIIGINKLSNQNIIYANQRLFIPAFIYEIQTEDTLTTISDRFGVSIESITKANQGRPDYQEGLIWPGFHLIISFNYGFMPHL
ncbi:hypothetical protein COE31_12140 [Priestia megaterium]|nr:hypothetical protein COE31_12140 [Priestia megaterium]